MMASDLVRDPSAAPGTQGPAPTIGPVSAMTAAAGVSQPTGPVAVARGLVRACRPRQWAKNVLVLAAPAAAGVLFEPGVLRATIIATVAFSLCASGGYLLNDALDVHRDRLHEAKRHRPVASGRVPVGLAKTLGAILMVGSVAAAAVLVNWQLAGVLAGYACLTFSYSSWLKHVPIVEMLAVAAGFLMRAVAGGVATDVPLSRWFLTVATFGSLYIVAGKRFAEANALGDQAVHTRRCLAAYPPAYLRQMREVFAGITLLAYCLWAFQGDPAGPPWAQLSVALVTFGVMRYALLLERGEGGAPEEVILGDRALLIAAGLWVVLFCLGAWRVGA
ncbi:MAG: decaprenyl-phosphate phosphoribosyltransferase [Frankiaceae bacterium]